LTTITNRSTKTSLARAISAVFSPYFVGVATVAIVSLSVGDTVAQGFYWFLTIAGIMVVPLLTYVFVQVRRGKITDMHIRDRRQRHQVYVLGTVTILIVVYLLWRYQAAAELVALFYSVLLVNLIGFLVNTRWKISLHAATMGGATVVLASLFGLAAAALMFLLSVLVMWARVETKSHTVAQTVAGYSLAIFITVAIFRYYGLM